MISRLFPGLDLGGDRGTSTERVRPSGVMHMLAALDLATGRTHEEQNAAIAACIRWRNARAEPKTNFAPDSPIRQWAAYPSKAA